MRTSVTVTLLAALVGAAVSGCGLLDSSPPPPAPAALPAPVSAAPQGTAVLPVVGLVGGTELVDFSTDDVSLRDKRTVYRARRRRPPGRHRLPGAGRQALRRRRRRRRLHASTSGRGHQGQAADRRARRARTSASTSTRRRTRCASSATPARTCGSRSRTPAANTADDKALTNPAAPPATGTVPAAGVASRRLHQQRR